MKLNSIFLQFIIIVIGIISIVLLIIFPLKEGRAESLTLWQIYLDPLILYMYISSTNYFISLFNSYKLIDNIKQNQVFTSNSIFYLRRIKKSAYLLSILIIIAGIYVTITHHKDDEPVGFLVLCFIITIISLTVASFASVFEQIIKKVMSERGENKNYKDSI